MKSIEPVMLPLAVLLICMSPALSAQTETELDMTMTIIEEGQGPEGMVKRIRLPSPEEIAAQDALTPETDTLPENMAERVEAESAELLGEAADVVNDTVKDALSIDGAAGLPGNIVDNLPDDLPLVDGITDEVDDELPIDDELPVIDPLGVMDGVNEAADISDSIDESVGESTGEAADMIDDIGVEEAAEDAQDNVIDQTDSILN
ncbi:MAG TPA: hypothetical protein VF268_07280 [Gammaproteobacteria bacterium]